MKTFVVLGLLVAVALADELPFTPIVPTSNRGCIYIDGMCVEECPEGTHSYSIGCNDAISERTCDEPQARDIGMICDLTRCDCDEPYVKDTTTNKCVLENDCPKKSTAAVEQTSVQP